MSFAIVHTRAISGITGLPVQVEADLANGLPTFSIVGLPDAAVREARDRVRAAITNSGFEFPQRRITVNLAPADLPKDSGRFDLPIAIGILAASGQVPAAELNRWEFVGELSLTGGLLPVRGAFALAVSTISELDLQKRSLMLPVANQPEAQLTESLNLGFAADLLQAAHFLKTGVMKTGDAKSRALNDSVNNSAKDSARNLANNAANNATKKLVSAHTVDFADVHGQANAKRVAEIAAAGRHNFLMMGPPGVGKSMIACRMVTLMPELTHPQACDLASIRSIDQGVDAATWRMPPYRAPHHSTPSRALIGGGQPVRPGEISLAHHGILFLDELPEFSRDTLEALREPLETFEVSIARVKSRIKLPADFMLVAAMNPCPCGYFGSLHPRHACKCSPDRIERYRGKISGPLMDRFDMAIHLKTEETHFTEENVASNNQSAAHTKNPRAQNISTENSAAENSAAMADRVRRAHDQQIARQGVLNSRLSGNLLNQVAVEPAGQQILQQTASRWGWSARAQHRVLKVARTIADLAQVETINVTHISEAIELRRAMDLPPSV
jgi:magnesium chelatase family protein